MKNTQANPKQKEQAIPACPACSHTRGTQYENKPLVHVCGACQAIFSNTIYLGESYEIVLPYMVPDDSAVPEQRLRYFDFTCLGSKGITRRHGWFDIQSRQIVQVG